MKTIFVTIGEFESNGGTLEKGRELFFANNDECTMFTKSGEYERFDEPTQCHIYRSNHGTFPTNPRTHIKIEVTPIWK